LSEGVQTVVECDSQVAGRVAVLCTHSYASAFDGVPRGYEWWRDDESGGLTVLCGECTELYYEAKGHWTEALEQAVGFKALCEGCAIGVGHLNGVKVVHL
jgi:hypothetical protein